MTNSLVFIDSRVADYQTLIAGLGADTAWVLIEADKDGVLQMQAAVSDYSDLDSIQIISHGSSGTLYLGSTVLNGGNLSAYESQLQVIGAGLAETGDILLYGCNVAQGDLGINFVNALAAITQADVAASDDLTGGNGDYSLEVSSGIIEQGIAIPVLSSPLLTYTSARDHLNQLVGLDFSQPTVDAMSMIAPLQSATLNSNNFFDREISVYDFLFDIERLAQIQDEFFLATNDINSLFDYMRTVDYSFYQTMKSQEASIQAAHDNVLQDATPGLLDYFAVNAAQAWEGFSGISSALLEAFEVGAGGISNIYDSVRGTVSTMSSGYEFLADGLGGFYVLSAEEIQSFANIYENTNSLIKKIPELSASNTAGENLLVLYDIEILIVEIADDFSQFKQALTGKGLSETSEGVVKAVEGIDLVAKIGQWAAEMIDIYTAANSQSTLSGLSDQFLNDAKWINALEGFDLLKQVIDFSLIPLIKNPVNAASAAYWSEAVLTLSDLVAIQGKNEWKLAVDQFDSYESLVTIVQNYQSHISNWLAHADSLSGSSWGTDMVADLPAGPLPVRDIFSDRYDEFLEEEPTASGGTLPSDSAYNGTIGSTDPGDWFVVNLVEGVNYQFTMEGTTLLGTDLSLYSPSGALLTRENTLLSDSNTSVIEWTGLTGSYFLVADSDGYFGDYTVSVEALTKISEVSSCTRMYRGHSMGEFSNIEAFAAIRADGSVVTWGSGWYGGDSSSVVEQLNGTIDVVQIFSTQGAFAALRADGSVITWGDRNAGGDSSEVGAELNGANDVVQVFSTSSAFAALRTDGSVVTWGDGAGGDSSEVATELNGANDVVQVFSTSSAFAALRTDGSVVTWGAAGGDSSEVAAKLNGANDVFQVFSTGSAFAALCVDGSVVTWGGEGGDSSGVAAELNGSNDVVQIFSTGNAFAAIRTDGSVVTWGNNWYGGDSSKVAAMLDGTNDVVQIFSSTVAFAALRADGSVVVWGDSGWDGSIYGVLAELDGTSDVAKIFSTGSAFAALRTDGSVFTWDHFGAFSSGVLAALDGTNDVIQIFSTDGAFAALRADGSVVTWGTRDYVYGADSSMVASDLDGTIDVVQIFSTGASFAALRADGSVVTWGLGGLGGDSTTVHTDLNSVVGMSDIFSANDQRIGVISLAEDEEWSLLPSAFNFADIDTGALQSITISRLESAGALKLDGVDVTLSQVITATDIAAGKLTFTPAANANGASYANFGFKVSDGTTLSSGAYTITMNVTAVRDDLLLNGESGNDSLTGDTIDAGSYDRLFGLAGNDTLDGRAGHDMLDGGLGDDTLIGGAGIDSMFGGVGDDTYYVDHASDTIGESSDSINGGIDTVFSSVTRTLGSYQEDLILTGSAAINGTGNNLANTLVGNSQDNTLNGSTGIDSMDGGLGDDTYYVDHASDFISESSDSINGGIDTVISTVTRTLGNYQEDLILSGSGAINGTGNSLANTLLGNSLANVLNGGSGIDSMEGGLGNDTYYVDHASDYIGESSDSINGGIDTVISTVTRTLGNYQENLTLSGSVAINGTGNSLANKLTGNSLANVLNGGTGVDSMYGGLGNDTYYVDHASDYIVESSDSVRGGIDTVISTLTRTLGNYQENLTLTGTIAINGTGNSLANVLTGNSVSNTLTGDAGNDTLNGGMGIDFMYGGLGNDTYYVDHASDYIVESSDSVSGGIDTVISTLTRTLGNYQENLTLTGTIAINGTGNSLANVLTGNSVSNTLTGDAGNDTLNGGMGIDSMYGGLGNDTYYVDHASDYIVESSDSVSGGIDTVISTVTRTLGNYQENLTLSGSAAINGTGNSLTNTLTGNSLANVLNGGAGIDSMAGGLGNDTYYVDNSGDAVSESSDSINGGIDTVISTVTRTLGSYQEHLTLSGSAAISGIGNSLANTLTGNSLANVLNGGTGIDSMVGGLGNDIYYVDNSSDVVSESSDSINGGIDTVISTVTRTLGNYQENLTLGGTAAINGTGNSLDNRLIGNSLANLLHGSTGNDSIDGGEGNDILIGGVGTDSLKGGMGNDIFDFNVVSELGLGTTRDIISGWNSGDRIDLATIDWNTVTTGDQAFSYIGGNAFAVAGQVRYSVSGSSGVLQINMDSDTAAEFELLITGSPPATFSAGSSLLL